MLGADQLGSGVAVVLVLGEQVPDEHRDLACHRDDGDAPAASRPQADEEGGQRPRCPERRVGGLAQEPPRIGLTGAADVAGMSRTVPGLAHPGVEPEVAHELGRTWEPLDVAHDREAAGGGHEADARDGQHVTRPRIVDDRRRDGPIGEVNLAIVDRVEPARGATMRRSRRVGSSGTQTAGS